jgi:hypothetical protein
MFTVLHSSRGQCLASTILAGRHPNCRRTGQIGLITGLESGPQGSIRQDGLSCGEEKVLTR